MQGSSDQIILLGDAGRTRLAADIINHHHAGKKMSTAEDIENIKKSDSHTAMLIFCTGELTYKESINILQQKRFASYKWFGNDSKSIVGSDNKNRAGDIMTS